MGNLESQVIIITGAAQRLGRAYAQALAKQGARVVIADINVEKAGEVERAIRAGGHDALALHADVTQEASTMDMVQSTLRAFGRVDVLINNAGYLSPIKMKPYTEIGSDEWDLVMAVNVRGPFLCAKAVAGPMKEQRRGKIINISSGTALTGRPLYLHYTTSKAAVMGMTRGLAKELGPWGITVNTITPGPILTEVARDTLGKKAAERIVESQSIKQLIKPEHVVGAVRFLCSRAA